jgi:hypothetical protein
MVKSDAVKCIESSSCFSSAGSVLTDGGREWTSDAPYSTSEDPERTWLLFEIPSGLHVARIDQDLGPNRPDEYDPTRWRVKAGTDRAALKAHVGDIDMEKRSGVQTIVAGLGAVRFVKLYPIRLDGLDVRVRRVRFHLLAAEHGVLALALAGHELMHRSSPVSALTDARCPRHCCRGTGANERGCCRTAEEPALGGVCPAANDAARHRRPGA